MRSLFLCLFLAGSVGSSVAAVPQAPAFFEATDDECQFVRDAIAALPREGGVVSVPAGVYNCKAPIVVARDFVELRGAGRGVTVFRLADWVHAPLLVIGHPHSIIRDGRVVTPVRVVNIAVSDMSFDGNKARHDVKKECGESHCDGDMFSIRNNTITIRGASHVVVRNVTAFDSISGGLVTEKFCSDLLIENFESHGNHFDGFAGYETEQSRFNNVLLHGNRGAGISIDIHFSHNVFKGGLLANNGDVGIFARELNGNLFDGMTIANSGSFGVFLASSVMGRLRECAKDNVFNDVKIINSKQAGIRVNDLCPGNRVTGDSFFLGNQGGCISSDRADVVATERSVICNK